MPPALHELGACGARQPATANAPLLLTSPGEVHVAAEGRLDVFAVQLEQGQPKGRRRFLLRAEPGELLPCRAPGRESGWGLLVSGEPGSAVCRVAGGFEGLLRETETAAATADALALLTQRLWRAVAGASLEATPLTPGEDAALRAGEAVTLEHAGFLRLTAAATLHASALAGPQDAASRHAPRQPEQFAAGALIPLTPGVAVTPEENCDATAMAFEAVLTGPRQADREAALAALEAQQGAVLDMTAALARRERQVQAERLEAQEEESSFRLTRTLAAVGQAITSRWREGALLAPHADPFLGALHAVAGRMGITITAPPQDSAEAPIAERLEEYALASMFRYRKVRLDGDWRHADAGPLLAFTREGVPVALLPRGAARYELHDPAAAGDDPVVRAVDDATAATLAKDAYMLYEPFPEGPVSGFGAFRFAMKGCVKDALMLVLFGSLAALLALLIPVMTSVVVNDAIPGADRTLLEQIGALLFVGVTASAGFALVQGVSLLRMQGKMDARLQAAVMDRLLDLPARFFKQFTAGDLADRAMGVNQIRTVLSGMTVNALLTAGFSTLNLLLLFYYDWALAVVALGFVGVNMAVVALLCISIVSRQRSLITIGGQCQGLALQFLGGIEKLRITASETRAFETWTALFTRRARLMHHSGMFNVAISGFNTAFPTLVTIALFFWYANYRLAAVNTGDFLSFLSAYTGFQLAMVNLVQVLGAAMVVIPLFGRARPILEQPPETSQLKARPAIHAGEVEVNHVTFRYARDAPPVLLDFSMRAPAGKFVALVGGSGAGKSTVFRVLLGFETPENGSVLYDGQDLETLDPRLLRRHIGVVLQDGKPKTGTIYENVAGSQQLPQDQVWEALRMVDLADDVQAMPMKLHTIVSEGGGTFSGGQIQRLLIARAIVRRPKILFLDEATSALDNRAQQVVSNSIAALATTRVVVAHRLSTIIHADTIYVLRHGRVEEHGSYEELMQSKGYFHELAKRQLA